MRTPLEPLNSALYPNVYAMREDLQQPGGGNKVRRFRVFLDNRKDARRIIAISDPGSHTFYVLSKLRSSYPHVTEWIFLERKSPMTAYQQENRRQYLNKSNISVITASFLAQFMRKEMYRMRNTPGTYILGIGGTTKDENNMAEKAFHECESQLSGAGYHTVNHVLPAASGQMLQGLYQGAKRSPSRHTFTAVFTGAGILRYRLQWKWRKIQDISILHPASSRAEIQKTMDDFYVETAIQLDPIHTGRAVHSWLQIRYRNIPTVLWITNPYLLLDQKSGIEKSGIEIR